MLSALVMVMVVLLSCGIGGCSGRVVEMAGRITLRRDFLERRPLGPASRESMRAARMKVTAAGRIDRRGYLALDHRISLLLGLEGRNLGEPRLRIGMIGRGKDLLTGA